MEPHNDGPFDFAYTFDRDGRFLHVNQPLLDLWGLQLADAVGKTFFELPYPADLAAHLHRQIGEVVATGATVRDETPYTNPSGAQGFYEYIFTPVCSRDGRVEMVAGSTRDITARKRTEIELATAIARGQFLLALDDALRPLVDADEITHSAATLLGRHLGVNRCAYATVDDDQDGFALTGNYTSATHSIVGHHRFRDFGAECLRLMRTGQPCVVGDSHDDPRIDAADRAAYITTDIRSVVCVPLLKAGRVVAAMAVHTNTPRVWTGDEVQLVQQVASRCWESIERARLSRTLQEAEARRERQAREQSEEQKRLLYSLFLQAPTLIAILRGADHVVELANPRICAIWGRAIEVLQDRPLFDVLPELRSQPFRILLDEVFASGLPHFGTETPAHFDRDGSPETVFFNFVYSPFRNATGQVEGVFVIASDVTIQVRARQELDDLRLAAEAANRAKDEFLAMLGHELRNPLSPILTALQLMKLRGDTSSERERVVIERQVRHLTRLIDDLLDVSRIAQGKVELRTEVMELADVVAKALELTAPLLEERAHRVTVDVPAMDLRIEGDPTRLAQVVSNLLANAAKYTDRGGHVTVRGRTEDGMVVLTVTDTGIGVSPDIAPQLFELFVQGRQQRNRPAGGLGLGLAIVRNLVEQHGGTVTVHSDGPGEGSEFTVRLPQVEGREPRGKMPSGVRVPARQGTARRVLIVDDNEDAALSLAELLEARGHTTIVAHDGPSAIAAATGFRPDLGVLDIGLPVMDGYELAARLREMPALAAITLVALTGYGQDVDRARSQAAGFRTHLVKPVDLRALDDALTDLPVRR